MLSPYESEVCYKTSTNHINNKHKLERTISLLLYLVRPDQTELIEYISNALHLMLIILHYIRLDCIIMERIKINKVVK